MSNVASSMERGNGNEVVGQDRAAIADDRRSKRQCHWLDFAAKEIDARTHHRCTSYGIYACFLGAKMEVQENLKSNAWNYVEVGGVLFSGARLA